MTLSDFIATVLVLVRQGRWDELGAYLAVIQEWQRTNPTGNQLSDLTEVKAGIKELRDLVIANQETIMSRQTELAASVADLKVAWVEASNDILTEIEQLKTALMSSGTSDAAVDAAIAELTATAEAMRAKSVELKVDD